jgi:hypothetical protein
MFESCRAHHSNQYDSRRSRGESLLVKLARSREKLAGHFPSQQRRRGAPPDLTANRNAGRDDQVGADEQTSHAT